MVKTVTCEGPALAGHRIPLRTITKKEKEDRFIYCSDSDHFVFSDRITHADLLVVMEQSGADGGRAVVIATIDPLMRMESLRN
jgi:hypothetical protein